jgi:protein TonB
MTGRIVGWIEAGVFVTFALGVHAGLAVAMCAMPDGMEAAGASGDTLISVEAADAAMTEMVERWEAPPETAEVVEVQDVPDLPQMPDIARPAIGDGPQLPRSASVPPQVLADADPLPDTTPPEPPKPDPEPEPARPVQSTARAGQIAQGAGGGVAAGQRTQSDAATLSAEGAALEARWGAQVRARVERAKRAPRSARGVTGRVVLVLSVARDGRLAGVSVRTSSGHAALDDAALRAVRAAGRFPAAPAGLSQPTYNFSLPISFSG